TAAKIAAIGLKRRILPIQDIEEIPVRAYRKRGFHIGGVRVQSSDREEMSNTSSELDLVAMTNASLRMGDACVIINEIRSRTAIQGVLNMLNTQPGIFLLYNLHAQSLKDIQDRLELVFGMPAASMYSTDRYSFLKKVRFGRKSRVYRMLGFQYETDLDKHQFTPVFTMTRGEDLDHTRLLCDFCDLPEASARELYNADLGAIAKKLKLKFVPPALKRRADETGLPINDYVMEAFYKGKVYDLIYHASLEQNEPDLVEIDFVLKCLASANRILKEHATDPDWSSADKQMVSEFNDILKQEMADRASTLRTTGQKAKEMPPAPKAGEQKAPAPASKPAASPAPSAAPKPAPASPAKAPAPKSTSPRKPPTRAPPKPPPKAEIADEDAEEPDSVV
ncbi:MAG: hypothetical protein KGH63_00575, partial [Candidatus Micrarchaeota archaeon]|nr:hypothetical protein [Candidatus Micrarchaeota archaeon]